MNVETIANYWPIIVQLAIVAAGGVAAGGGISTFIDKTKNALGFSGYSAWAYSKIIAGIFALILAVVSGAIVPEVFSDPTNATVLLIQIATGFGATERAADFKYNNEKANQLGGR